ncbi:MAG: hypothetical protein WDM79_12390 [Terricaulis sp.]
MNALPEGRLTIELKGSAGQSLGAFMAQGIAIDVTGDSNDYVGKGLSGGLISLKPPPEAAASARTNAIIGNTCLYGATSGKLFGRRPRGRTLRRAQFRRDGCGRRRRRERL